MHNQRMMDVSVFTFANSDSHVTCMTNDGRQPAIPPMEVPHAIRVLLSLKHTLSLTSLQLLKRHESQPALVSPLQCAGSISSPAA